MNGLLIAIEGSDGGGKFTQARLLVRRLQDEGCPATFFSFPQYKTGTGLAIRAMLNGRMGRPATKINPYRAATLFAADRAHNIFLVEEAQQDHDVVVLDRYVDSNKAHQGAKLHDSQEREWLYRWIDKVEYDSNALPRPDITILLVVDTIASQQLLQQEEEALDDHEGDISYLEGVTRAYRELVQRNPEHYRVIDCMDGDEIKSREEIHAMIWDVVRKEIERREQ